MPPSGRALIRGVDAETEPGTRRRGRPRDPELEQRVLTAAVQEYAERGWAGLTMDGVARRAGVGKSTLYLRWPDKDALLAAAVKDMGAASQAIDTGGLRSDLEVLARSLHTFYADPTGWAMTRIMIDAAGSGEQLGGFAEVVNGIYRPAALAVFERAVARGEARPDIPAQLVVNVVYGTEIVYAMMRPWDEKEGVVPDPEEAVRRLVDFCMAGMGPWLTGQ
ncbi:MAG: Transcriptional regulator, AcrR family [uncultured Nocardioidaceae bacterium]|uniref:Transcriptional regulator, AcrR family n=1 Tax=uncultured Nocardioidaceae bacterium TaxID=253824 RepID=A0A6J4MVF8_9ACTN|nr:MAG: Transcriptional regulator, AcrR family [uncultured Nocardioidaceae bacterium]